MRCREDLAVRCREDQAGNGEDQAGNGEDQAGNGQAARTGYPQGKEYP